MTLEARSVGVRLGGREVVTHVSLHLREGEIVGLVGPNGAGKSTLMRALAGVAAISEGAVLLNDAPIAQQNRRALAREIAYLPQEGRVHWRLSVEDAVMLGRSPHRAGWGPPRDIDLAAAERAMAAVGVAEFRLRDVTELSTGERARVLLARALAVEAGVLLVDEPAAALDPLHQIEVMGVLQRTAQAGAAVLAVIHDLGVAARFTDRLVLMQGGRVVVDGPSAEVLGDPRLAEAFGVDLLRGEHQGAPWAMPWSRREG